MQRGVVTDPANPAFAAVLGEESHAYNDRRLRWKTASAIGGNAEGVTQFGYDARNRLQCTAVRMNEAVWNSLPASACALSTQGAEGPRAYATPLQQNYATYTYSPNGHRTSVTDANGNRADLRHDGHGRQVRWVMPSPTTPGAVNEADYEQYAYDAAGNRTSFRKRDGSTLTFQYDALNRMIVKVVPERSGLDPTHTRDVYYGYDVGNRQLYARFDSHSGEGVASSYDSLGRLTGSSQAMDGVTRTLAYTLEAGGRRTQLRWPNSTYISYTYDAAGRMLAMNEGPIGSTATLWSYSYTDYGRRVRRTSRYGNWLEAQADGGGRLTSLTTEFAATANDNVTAFAFNNASQIASRSIANDLYVWAAPGDEDRDYAVNGLNQYTAVDQAALAYDANGNLTGDPGAPGRARLPAPPKNRMCMNRASPALLLF